jgi:hypothetical protein
MDNQNGQTKAFGVGRASLSKTPRSSRVPFLARSSERWAGSNQFRHVGYRSMSKKLLKLALKVDTSLPGKPARCQYTTPGEWLPAAPL